MNQMLARRGATRGVRSAVAARFSGMNRNEVPIASPCNVDWSTMTLADRGRFCGACRKVVRELRHMTEAEARALLASPPTEGLCVRYVHDATGEYDAYRAYGQPGQKIDFTVTAIGTSVVDLYVNNALVGETRLGNEPPKIYGTKRKPRPSPSPSSSPRAH